MQAHWNVSLKSVGSLLLVICLGFAGVVSAQGLGDIEATSRINQPLRADIPLLDIGDLDASQIEVTLASPEEFQNRGIQRLGVLSSLQFEVEVTGGAGVIHVSTVAPVEEPFLNFLINVRWPNGGMLREYTALLDLPTFAGDADETPAPAIAAPQTASPAASTPASTPNTAANAGAQGDYTVQGGDSLWQIASRLRPDGNVSIQQTMVAIQRANESAFINNNINRIRSGSVLRIPSSAEISAIDQATAIAAVSGQNQQLSAQPLAVNNAPRPAGGARPNDELTILSGNENAGGGGGGADANIAALENELMLSEEGLDRARLENLELTNRLAALQEQIDILQNIIAAEDAQMAQLQASLTEQAEQTEQALVETQSVADELANETAAAQQNDEGVMGLLKNTAVLTGALVALVLLALGVMFVRRRNVALAEDNTFEFEANEQEAMAAAEATIVEENTAEVDKPERESINWGAAVAAFFARFRRKEAVEEPAEEPQAEVTGGSYGPDAAFRNPPEEKIEPTLETEEEILAAEAMADEAFDEVAQDDVFEVEEPALNEQGNITYVEPSIVREPEEDLVAQAGDLMEAVAPEPAEPEVIAPVLQEEVVLEEAAQDVVLQEAAEEVVLQEAAEEVVLQEAAAEEVVLQEASAEEVVLQEPAAEEVVLQEFVPEEVVLQEAAVPEEAVLEEAQPQEAPDVFEFSLRTDPVAEAQVAPKEPEPALETIAFTPAPPTPAPEKASAPEAPVPETPASAHASEYQQVADLEPATPDIEDDLVDLAFDDTFVPDAAEEEGGYMPTAPNNAQDAKLDLAVAYEAMGDVDGAIEILDEVIGAGSDEQIAEAERLKAKWQNS